MSADNVSNISIEEVKEDQNDANKSQDVNAPVDPKMIQEFTLNAALQAIYAHYKRDKINIEMVAPNQMLDGQIVDFLDKDSKEKLATARLRTRNQLILDKETGQLSIVAYFSDLSATRSSISFTLGK